MPWIGGFRRRAAFSALLALALHGLFFGTFFFRFLPAPTVAGARVGDFQVSLSPGAGTSDGVRKVLSHPAWKDPQAAVESAKAQLKSETASGSEQSPNLGSSTGGSGERTAPPGNLLDELRAKIEAAVEYPVSLQRRRVTGTVILELVIASDGSLRRYSVVRSSGHEELDRLAERAVRNAIGAHAPSDSSSGSVIRLPIEFQVNPPRKTEAGQTRIPSGV